MKTTLEDCTRICCETRQECLRTLQRCLKQGGKLADTKLALKLTECMRQAQLAADCCTTESEVCGPVCAACADACEDCARCCDALAEEETSGCARILRRCAEACREAAALRTAPGPSPERHDDLTLPR